MDKKLYIILYSIRIHNIVLIISFYEQNNKEGKSILIVCCVIFIKFFGSFPSSCDIFEYSNKLLFLQYASQIIKYPVNVSARIHNDIPKSTTIQNSLVNALYSKIRILSNPSEIPHIFLISQRIFANRLSRTN